MLKIIIESLDEVEEAYRGLYKEANGKFILQVGGIEEHPTVATLKRTMENVKNERNTAKADLEALKTKIGGDLPEDWSMDKWLELKALEDDDDDKTAEGKARRKAKEDERLAQAKKNYETQIANLTKKYTDDTAALKAENEKLIRDRASDKADLELEKAMDAANIDPKFRPAVQALHRSSLKHAIDDDGKIRIFVDTDLGEATVNDYINSWSQGDAGKIYVTVPVGPGGKGGSPTGGAGGNNPFSKANWNKTEQLALRSEPAKLDRMAKAAGFKDGQSAIIATKPIG